MKINTKDFRVRQGEHVTPRPALAQPASASEEQYQDLLAIRQPEGPTRN